jgi:hypothetical protein
MLIVTLGRRDEIGELRRAEIKWDSKEIYLKGKGRTKNDDDFMIPPKRWRSGCSRLRVGRQLDDVVLARVSVSVTTTVPLDGKIVLRTYEEAEQKGKGKPNK